MKGQPFPVHSFMKIGIDFDNTIICYDKIFYQAALERELITSDFSENLNISYNSKEVIPDKNKIRDYLRSIGREDEWTKMQGYVYGVLIAEAEPFEGILDFLIHCREKKININIISHKTRYPYSGEKYDLHEAAYSWIEKNILNIRDIRLTKSDIFFEESQNKKIERIIKCCCTHFIDDLPEFLAHKEFPPEVTPILFTGDVDMLNSIIA